MPSTMSAAPSLPLVPTEDEKLLRATVAAIAADFGPDYYARVNAEHRPPHELWEALGERGYLGVHLPEEFGGGGLGIRELTIVLEETAAAGCPLLSMVVSPGIIGTILTRHGSAQQKSNWLPGIASAQRRFSFALTEPGAGSNSHNLVTAAERRNGSYVINGQKTFITGVDECDGLLVVARSAPRDGSRGRLSLLMVDPHAPGLTLQPIDTVVEDPERQFTVFFDDVETPVEHLVGGEGEGLSVLFDGLNPERILSAAVSTGLARYALEKACAYARQRHVWSAPIATHQAISHPLANGKVKLDQARLMTEKAAALYDSGLPAGEAANIAKLAGAEAGVFCMDAALQTHGGNGVAREYQLSQYWFLTRLHLIAPVSREMILNFVAEHSLGLPKSYNR